VGDARTLEVGRRRERPEEAYMLVRRAAAELDHLAPVSMEGREARHAALAALYEAEDHLHRLKGERVAA
jgi:hypothetical protein